MKGVTLRTERLIVRDLPPLAAGRVARFHRENWDFHRPWEPHRHPRYFAAASQRRILAAERRSQSMLHLWLLLRAGEPEPQPGATVGGDDAADRGPEAPAASGHAASPAGRGVIRWGRLPVIGSVTLSSIVRGFFQNCLLGYKMDARFVRRGYMSEAVAAVLDYAFSTAELHRVEANVMPGNAASRGLLDGLGFREEGCARKYLKIQGTWEDHLHMVMLRDEWTGPASGGDLAKHRVQENAGRG